MPRERTLEELDELIESRRTTMPGGPRGGWCELLPGEEYLIGLAQTRLRIAEVLASGKVGMRLGTIAERSGYSESECCKAMLSMADDAMLNQTDEWTWFVEVPGGKGEKWALTKAGRKEINRQICRFDN